jgi:hypothetical protein
MRREDELGTYSLDDRTGLADRFDKQVITKCAHGLGDFAILRTVQVAQYEAQISAEIRTNRIVL